MLRVIAECLAVCHGGLKFKLFGLLSKLYPLISVLHVLQMTSFVFFIFFLVYKIKTIEREYKSTLFNLVFTAHFKKPLD